MSTSAKSFPGKAIFSTPTDREIRAERTFNASRERVWQAFTDPTLLAQWWGRGHKLDIERMEVKRGGRWRYVEHAADDAHGFEGRYREVVPHERLVQTFEWDGMPGYVTVTTTTFEDLGDGRTKIVMTAIYHTTQERDGMLGAGMEEGMNESYAALDAVLAGEKR
jgi:uncharacterized protein YndB with AHSA1/START domain